MARVTKSSKTSQSSRGCTLIFVFIRITVTLKVSNPVQSQPGEPPTHVDRLSEIDSVHANDLTCHAFTQKYMASNIPVIIEGCMDDDSWKGFKDWVASDGSIHISHLQERYGDSAVCVTDMSSQTTQEMTLSDYCSWWTHHTKDEQLLYLKDWHFYAEMRRRHQPLPYHCPSYFSDDWLNEWLDSTHQLDYRFVYMGPAGTKTCLHADVFRSFSWSANVVGVKHWKLLPPSSAHLLYDRYGRNTAPSLDVTAVDAEVYPGLEEAQLHVVTVFQRAGQVMFIPSGWFHEVVNVTDALSINQNWFNAHNASSVINHLHIEYEQARLGIIDCLDLCENKEEFDMLVQRNMAANCGLSLHDWTDLLRAVLQSSNSGRHSLRDEYRSQQARLLLEATKGCKTT